MFPYQYRWADRYSTARRRKRPAQNRAGPLLPRTGSGRRNRGPNGGSGPAPTPPFQTRRSQPLNRARIFKRLWSPGIDSKE